MRVRIGFRDVPPAYFRSNSFYSRVVAAATGEPVDVVTERPHIVFQSVHPRMTRRVARRTQGELLGVLGTTGRRLRRWREVETRPALRGGKTIWFTGENIRPPAGDWGATFSFDLDPLGGTNFYLPLWWENLGLLGEPSTTFSGIDLSRIQLTQKRDSDVADRPRFACAFIGNPTRMRLHAINLLSRLGDVDVFGSAVGRPVINQNEVAREYRYMLCFENDLYPGYVTEKPLDAWANGCIPLWWGSDPAELINPHSLLNAAELHIDGMVERIGCLESDRSSLKALGDQPFLRHMPDLSDVMEAVRRVLK